MRKIFFLFIYFIANAFNAQVNYPVQLQLSALPPYSPYLADYSASGTSKLRLIATLNDFSLPSYSLRLKIKISGSNGINIESKNFYYAGPFLLSPGVPELITGEDLSDLLSSTYLNFSGVTQNWYDQNKILPEGNYNVCITAYDGLQNKIVSNEACFSMYFTLNDPPLLNAPQCGQTVSELNPQQLFFQWTPLHYSANPLQTSYEFSLYEVRPQGNSPINVVQTTAPIFTESTTQTFLSYGIAEPPLQTGMQYVWRVKAIDADGHQFFKNDGYSALCDFTYGSIYASLDSNSIRLKLDVAPLTHRLARARWDSMGIFSSYELQYKKKNTQEWFSDNVSNREFLIRNLEALTTYEARVRGINSEITGPFSELKEFTTPARAEIVCGQNTVPPDLQNFKPLTQASNLMIWEVGSFDMLVTSLGNYNSQQGIYSGYGKIEIPFMRINLKARFVNVKVNDMAQVVQGRVEILTKGMEAWLGEYEENHLEEHATYFEGSVDSVYIQGNEYCITQEGNTICFPIEELPIVIRDEEGNQWIIEGNPPQVSGPKSFLTYSGDALEARKDFQVEFIEEANQKFGFDKYEHAADIKNYECILLSDSSKYFVPYKSLKSTESDKLLAKIKIENFNENELSFKSGSGAAIPHTKQGEYFLLTAETGDCIYALYQGKRVGKINLKHYSGIHKKVIIVPVNNANINLNQEELNKIYAQAGVSITIEQKQNFTYTLPAQGLESSDATVFSKYSAGMRTLRDAWFAANPNEDKKQIILFVVSTFSQGDLQGYMVRGRSVGFIKSNADTRVYAHELAHGIFSLEHTFPKIAKGITKNLLDYGNDTKLSSAQWDEMQNPNTDLHWRDDEEDGAYAVSDFYNWVKDVFGFECLKEYETQEGIMPQCLWNNSGGPAWAITKYNLAYTCGFIDALYISLENAWKIAEFLSCYNILGSDYHLQHCQELRNKTAELVKGISELIRKEGAMTQLANSISKELGNAAINTLCPEPSCAYNMGKAAFEVLSLFAGVGEVNAMLGGAMKMEKIPAVLKIAAGTTHEVIKAFQSVGYSIKKTSAGLFLMVQLNTGGDFILASLDATKKAVKFNNAALSPSVPASWTKRLKNIKYLTETGQIKQGDIDLLEYGNNNTKFVGWREAAGGAGAIAKYPINNFLEYVNSTFSAAQKQLFDKTRDFYRGFNPSFNVNELRGIDFDLPVTNVVKKENNIMYQMSTIDPVTGNPKFGSYFFENVNEDITKLGIGDLNRIKADGRVKVKITLNDEVDFLKTTTANIEDWAGSGNIFKGGGNQFYNPTAKAKIKSFEIVQTY